MSARIRSVIEESHDRTALKALGIIIDKLDSEETILSLTVDDRHRQHIGLVHGGIYVLLAESAASLAGACALQDDRSVVLGIEINANHVRSCAEGVIVARSKCLHRGHRTMVYEVRVVDGEDRLLSIARTTLLVTRERSVTSQ